MGAGSARHDRGTATPQRSTRRSSNRAAGRRAADFCSCRRAGALAAGRVRSLACRSVRDLVLAGRARWLVRAAVGLSPPDLSGPAGRADLGRWAVRLDSRGSIPRPAPRVARPGRLESQTGRRTGRFWGGCGRSAPRLSPGERVADQRPVGAGGTRHAGDGGMVAVALAGRTRDPSGVNGPTRVPGLGSGGGGPFAGLGRRPVLGLVD